MFFTAAVTARKAETVPAWRRKYGSSRLRSGLDRRFLHKKREE